jgi:hypothetical protein
MPTPPNVPGNPERISVLCSCGKRLSAPPQHAGKRMKCPVCGQPVVVAATPPPSPMVTVPQVSIEPKGMSKSTLITLWSLCGVFTIGCVLILVWYSHASHEADISAANNRVVQSIAAANDWIAGKSSLDGESIEQDLAYALNDKGVTEKENGEVLLNQVRQRRKQLADEARAKHAQQQATARFNNAKSMIDNKQVSEAIPLLRKYVDDPDATETADAKNLLAEAEMAVSDSIAVDTLTAIDDAAFDRVKAGGVFNDGKVTRPVLVAILGETIRKNLDAAAQRREENRIAEVKRERAEQLAATERHRQEVEQRNKEDAERQRQEASQPLKVFLGGELHGDYAAYYRLLPKSQLEEVKKPAAASVFEKHDDNWESSYVVDNIVLAPGAVMRVNVENYNDGSYKHCDWSWNIKVAVPDGVSSYKGISFEYAIGSEVERLPFVLAASAKLDGYAECAYAFREHTGIVQDEDFRPADDTLRRMVSGGAVKYRIKTGPPVIGPTMEGELPPEAIQALKDLLSKAKYKNSIRILMDPP